jgi:hypothetical protein
MKALTRKRQQWLWFAVLWCGGLAAALLVAHVVRWMVSIL